MVEAERVVLQSDGSRLAACFKEGWEASTAAEVVHGVKDALAGLGGILVEGAERDDCDASW